MQQLYTDTVASPVGKLRLVANNEALVALVWENDKAGDFGNFLSKSSCQYQQDHPILVKTRTQLTEYFAKERTTFDIPLEPISGTDFQKQVWLALRTIPFGETRSYKAIAEQIGNPAACRAVGAANGKNPLSIIVPCHRVIGASGKLTGFGGGLPAKEYLLSHEGTDYVV